MITRIFILLLMATMLNSCVEEFLPELDDFDHILVVDGAITNQQGPYTIKLSISAGLDITTPTPVSNATVSIVEENGIEETLTEVNPGSYQTKSNGIQGVVGNKYKLLVTTNGKKYETEYELLKEPTAISSVDAQVEYKSFPDAPEVVPGIQFYVNTATSPYKDDYFLWRLRGTYKYEANMLIYYIFEGSLKEFPNHDSLKTCYRTYDVSEIFTKDTKNLTVPQVLDKPMFFLPATDKKLTIRYSLNTSQYSVSKEAYDFWNNLEQQTNNNSSLHTFQPFQIRGNLKNINDPSEPVLGYFLVAGVSEKRIFVELPEEIEIYIEDCALDYMGYAWIFYTRPSEWPIYVTEGESGGRAIAGGGCMDCRESGGVLEKPDFWVD